MYPEYGDWFRDGHVIQSEPMKFSPGAFVENIGRKKFFLLVSLSSENVILDQTEGSRSREPD